MRSDRPYGVVYLTALCGLTDRETVEPHPQEYRCFAHISLLSACNRRGYIPTPTTLSRSENATTREILAISTACRNNTRDWCNRAIAQHHPETKNSSGYSEHETRCWVENFGYYGWGELREVYHPPLAKCNTTIYSATPQPTHKFCYTSGCGIHTLQPHGVAFSAQRWVYFRRGER